MLKIRFGALPVIEVKMPQVAPGKLMQPALASVRWSSQYGKTV